MTRWGGDEFAVGVWEGREKGASAQQVLKRVAGQLRDARVVLAGGEKVRLTFSGGVSRVSRWREGDDAQGLFRRADEALYRAKKARGDTVVYAD